MALKFNESTYLKSKLAQCNEEGLKDASGNAYTLASLKAAIEKAGFTLEEHYHKYADSEGTHAYGNMDFDEDYYLESKLAQLTATGHTGWTKAALIRAIHNIGLTVEQHFQKYSTTEGTSANPYFNTSEYLAAKLNQLQNNADAKVRAEWADKSVDDVAAAIKACGMSAEEHYARYGVRETDASGNLINPSNAFDANGYASAKLAELQKTDPTNWSGKSAADVMSAIAKAGMSPVSHYERYGQAEAEATNTPMVQTVPVVDRVANDSLRNATGDNVPSNYNKSTPAPSSVTKGSAVTKPCDVADSATEKPSEPVATPSDANYVPVPGNGVTDTNSKPVEIVTATTVDANGNEVTVTQYGVTTTTDGGSTTKGIDATGKVTTTDIKTVANGANGSTTTTTNVTQGSTTIQQTAADDGKGTVETTTKTSLNGGTNTIEQSATATTSANGSVTTKTETTVKNADGKTVMTQTATETANASGSRSSTDYTTTNYDAATGEVTGTQTGTTTKTTTSAGTETTKTNATVKDADGNTTGTILETITKSTDANGNAVTKVQGTEKDASGKTVATTDTTTTATRAANGTLTTKTEGKTTDADGNTTTISETATTVTNPRTGTVTENKVVDNVTTDSTGKTVATESGTVKSTTTADGSATKTTNITETATDANGNTTSTKTDTTAQFDASKGTTTTTGTQTTTGANGKSETTDVNETKAGDSAGSDTTPSQQATAESSSGNAPSAEEPTEDENKDDEQGTKDDEQGGGGSTEPITPTPTATAPTLKAGADGYSWDATANTLTLTFTEDIASINGATEAEKLAQFTVPEGVTVSTATVSNGKVVLTLSGTDGKTDFDVVVKSGAVVGKTSELANSAAQTVSGLDDSVAVAVTGKVTVSDAEWHSGRSEHEVIFTGLPDGVEIEMIEAPRDIEEIGTFTLFDGKITFTQGYVYTHAADEDSHTIDNVILKLTGSDGNVYTSAVAITITDDQPTVKAPDGSAYTKQTISLQGGETAALLTLDYGADYPLDDMSGITVKGIDGIYIDDGGSVYVKSATSTAGGQDQWLGLVSAGSDGVLSFKAASTAELAASDLTFTFTDNDGDSVSAEVNLTITANGTTDFRAYDAYEIDGDMMGLLVAKDTTGLKVSLRIDDNTAEEAVAVTLDTPVTFKDGYVLTLTQWKDSSGSPISGKYGYVVTLPDSAPKDHTYTVTFTQGDANTLDSVKVYATYMPYVKIETSDGELNKAGTSETFGADDIALLDTLEIGTSYDVYQPKGELSLTTTAPTEGTKIGTLTYDKTSHTFSFTQTAAFTHETYAVNNIIELAVPVTFGSGETGDFVVNLDIIDTEPTEVSVDVSEWNDGSIVITPTIAWGADDGAGSAISYSIQKGSAEAKVFTFTKGSDGKYTGEISETKGSVNANTGVLTYKVAQTGTEQSLSIEVTATDSDGDTCSDVESATVAAGYVDENFAKVYRDDSVYPGHRYVLQILDNSVQDAEVMLKSAADGYAAVKTGTTTHLVAAEEEVTGVIAGSNESDMTISSDTVEDHWVHVEGTSLKTLKLAGSGDLCIFPYMQSSNKVVISGTGEYEIYAQDATHTLEGSSHGDTVLVSATKHLDVELKGGADSLVRDMSAGNITVKQGLTDSVAATAVNLGAGSDATKWDAGDTITFGSGVDTIEKFESGDKIDFGMTNLVSLVGKAADLAEGTYYAYGTFDAGTGVFTLADSNDNTADDTLVFSLGENGSVTDSTSAVVLIGFTLEEENMVFTTDPVNP